MQRIAFFLQKMGCGGVETSFLALCEKIIQDTENQTEITVFLAMDEGELRDEIPKEVRKEIIPIPANLRKHLNIGGTKINLRKQLDHHQYGKAVYTLLTHVFGKSDFSELSVDFSSIPPLQETYDIAICYNLHSPFLVKYVSEKVQAGKKYAWIHNDFETTGYQIKKLEENLNSYSRFLCVSRQLQTEFIKLFPQYKEKTAVYHNIVSAKMILEKAECTLPQESWRTHMTEGSVVILTVGRLEEQKGYALAIDVCKGLVEKKLPIIWLAVGEGSLHKALDRKIRKCGLQNHFFLLGAKKNPYPYYKLADLYVQPSVHEGWGISVSEARVFMLPIVCTDFAGAREQKADYEGICITEGNESSIEAAVCNVISKTADKRHQTSVEVQTPHVN